MPLVDESIYGRFARAVKPVVLLFLFVATLALATQVTNPYPSDFVSFWAAGILALDGNPAAAYDVAVHRAVEEQGVAMRGDMPFPYPPPFLILAAPFSLLPYVPALLCWVVATLTFYLLCLRTLAPRAGLAAAAFPPVLTNAIIGQVGFILCGLLAAGLALLPKRPLIGGALLGILILKPQLGLVLPFALLAAREWRAIAGAAMSTMGVLLIGVVLFGMGSYEAWIAQAPLYASIATEGLTGWNKMASVYAALRLAGTAHMVALVAHFLVAVVVTLAACAVWRRTTDLGPRAASLAAATALASPYLYSYDAIILVIPFLWLAETARDRPLLVPIWIIALMAFLQNWTGDLPVNVAPLAALGLFALVCRRVWRRARPDTESLSSAGLAPQRVAA
ncbi:glycosyltransferase family 87 protein [Sphingosinicella sp. LHD-64]|uniref:glycosyltransferase family 87 protein n=1 Tax=Sphingosinicella sp. LHD-64 TaxID=3072139 RepID=UPI00280D12C3|nr:glycosyltransferase family 87 protein [Sphingosinicella sp. LHD-64]MDQ8754884.1 glycosyltransferase family 87 protein [Sphingosinicella sp. LHD-64]